MEKKELAVGDSTEIEIIFSAGTRRGRFSKSPRLYTSDPGVTETRLRLQGEILENGDPMLNALMNFEPFGLDIIIGQDDDAILAACAAASDAGVVEAVNFNSPGQVVIAGQVAAVDRAIENCKASGAKKAMPLPVSAPFHTSLMVPAGEKLAEQMAALTFSAPAIPVVHNVDAKPLSDPEAIKAILVKQISSPVQWVACVEYMAAQGIAHAVECGPGKVLTGLNRRIVKSVANYALEDMAGLQAALSALKA